jgi:hypothetical protein
MQINTGQKADRARMALSWSTRIWGLSKVLGAILFFALYFNSIQAFSATVPVGHSVALSWNPSPDTNVIGYNVYYGVASRTYTNMIKVGNVTSATIAGLAGGVTYYFAATSYDSLGHQSDYSGEASYAVPPPIFKMQIRNASAGQFTLTVASQIGHTYEIQATQDFKTWTTIGIVTVGVSGSLDFTDTNAVNFPQRFYRIRDIQP